MKRPRTVQEDLADISRESADVARYYDDWAEDYDAQITGWGYSAPETAARRLLGRLPPPATLIDVGCGTGLTGAALRAAGYEIVDGVDVSDRSLEIAAATGHYRRTEHADFQALPTTIESNAYDGLLCVGVLTYLPETEAVLREFARIVRPGGWMVITEREDLFAELDVQAALDALVAEGVLAQAHVSEASPYLPTHRQFGDQLGILYLTLQAGSAGAISVQPDAMQHGRA
ncbi:MAG: class I SAM-dependent methyltransferase [Pseudomonadales bacterium]|jgi:predicted TPR repeat methyltransferase|nr:class I SAM-dependent methyltransferase [Pseudomonadales bacterium]